MTFASHTDKQAQCA